MDDGLYYGRVRSPNTYGNWKYGYFSQEQLEEAQAYRVDEGSAAYEPLFPDLDDLLGSGEYDSEETGEGGYRLEE